MRKIFISLSITFSIVAACASTKTNEDLYGHLVKPTSEFVTIKGTNHAVTFANDSVWLNRHSAEFLDKSVSTINPINANSASGISVLITTDAKRIKPKFSGIPGSKQKIAFFAIYRNGEFVDKKKGYDFELINETGEKNTWQIYMPIFNGVTFKGFELDKEAKLYPNPTKKQDVYVAIGNSITHGTGQYSESSDNTYPSIVARTLDLDLYNIAVGGSRITPEIPSEFENLEADIITLLWGYNDWNANTHTIEELSVRYAQLLRNIRETQPKATIYAILPTFTTADEPKLRQPKTDKIDKLRQVEIDAIEAQIAGGDDKLIMVDGQALSSEQDLCDKVHFSAEGASNFANKLIEIIGQ